MKDKAVRVLGPRRRRSVIHHISWTGVTLILTLAFSPVPVVSGQDKSAEITMATLPDTTAGAAKESTAVRGFDFSSSGINYIIPGKLSVGIMYREAPEEEYSRQPGSPDTFNDDEFAALINIEIKF
ncbi:MAG: hypothetical protein ACM34I_08555 [bacterium]